MKLEPGTRLGPYEVVAPIGAGGMGQVFEARDTRLDRSVAIKILPPEFATDAQLRLRFEREAKTISQLTHPSICRLYDVGDNYLVMELLDGETLAERLTKGPLPIDQVIRYGIEIADALDNAHKAGVVHRDLKPGNIMITKSGAKLLDFGLAKPSEFAEADGRTLHKTLTEEGTLIGTFQYMAPEQLESGQTSARSDIFAFGAVLYEMATGRRAFDGRSRASIIASILGAEPRAMSELDPIAPRRFEQLVRTCLSKDPDERWQCAHDLATELRWIHEPVAAQRGRSRSAGVAWTVAALLAAASIAGAAAWMFTRKPLQPIVTEIMPPVHSTFGAQLSPDGTKILISILDDDGKRKLMIRSLEGEGFSRLEGTEDAFSPFWSRDSRAIYFFAKSSLFRIQPGGGPVEKIADNVAEPGVLPRGGTINRDGVILVATGRQVMRIERSGKSTVVSQPRRDELWHIWPWFLPDGKHFLYWVRKMGRNGEMTIHVASIDSADDEIVARSDSRAFYVEPGYLIYSSGNNIVAQKFDARSLRVAGEPVALGQTNNGMMPLMAGGLFSASDTGMLIYRNAIYLGSSQLMWFDSTGHQVDTLTAPGLFWDVSIAPDGKRVAMRIAENGNGFGHLWLYDVDRKIGTRLTAGDLDEAAPIWSPGGDSLFFTATDFAEWTLNRRPTGADAATALSHSPYREYVSSVSPDGRFALVHTTVTNGYRTSLMSLADGKRTPFGDPRFVTKSAKFSPDGKWVAYVSDASDRDEIYVQRFPDGGAKTRISSSGGDEPVWSAGNRLDYHQLDDTIVAVDLKLGETVEPGQPQTLFKAKIRPGPNQQYDVTADGKRILANVVSYNDDKPYILIQNWTAKLK